MAKFKVGDRVKSIGSHDGDWHIGLEGTVVLAREGAIRVKFDRSKERGWGENKDTWGFNDSHGTDCLELIEPANPARYTGELKEGMRVKIGKCTNGNHTGRIGIYSHTDNYRDAWVTFDKEPSCTYARDLEVISEPEEKPQNAPETRASREPITNSPAKGAKKPMTLKKVTNLIRGLGQPLKNYVRLGWVIIENDDYEVTEDGQEALNRVHFGIADADTLEKYAEKEVRRLKKEAKDKEDEE